MNCFDAIKELFAGKRIRMPTWTDKGQYLFYDKEKDTFMGHLTNDPKSYYHYFHAKDFQVDWELMEDKE